MRGALVIIAAAFAVFGLRRRGSNGAGGHFTVKDSSIVIPRCVRNLLSQIANDFYASTGNDLVVTDGSRTIGRQAKMLFLKLEDGEDIVRLYAAKSLAREIVRAYQDDPSESAIAAVLRDQVESGRYISKHLRSGALDLRTRDFSSGELAKLKSTIRSHGVQVVDETGTSRPHYHLNFTACL